ncbi:MAG: formate dehydrogenase subunit alpha [Pirellulales bacterium]|nr:formate dehydrogenase subunit alpha [Pirellulales bacterium]
MPEPVTLTIDDMRLSAAPGTTVLEAALAAGIYIPHLCHHPDLKPVGVCRLCMVDVAGRGMVLSCLAPVEQGMVVRTESPQIHKVRRTAAELLVLNHRADCLSCGKNNRCELQRIAAYAGVDPERLGRMRRRVKSLPVDDSNPFFRYDPNQCVLCGICVRTCDEIVGVNALDFAFRGFNTMVSTFGNVPIVESACVSCGECVARCPVEALLPKKVQPPAREVKTICPYCGVGCSIHLGIRGGRIVGVRGDADSPVNQGRLCVKGRFGHDFVNHPDRLTSPRIRKNGEFVEASWDEALDLVARKLAEHRGAFAAMASAKCTNEENYLLQKFTRQVMGTNNVDHCARLCHSPSVAGLAQSFGSGAMTNTIEDIAGAACILAIGTNTTAAHPVLALKIKEAVRRGATLIVANPKQIDLARHAGLVLRHRAGSDVALLMGMMRVIVDEGLADEAFCNQRCANFDALEKSLRGFPLDFAEQTTGVPRDVIAQAARTFATSKPATILFAMGITQHTHGTDNVLAVSNLALLTGNVGKPSSGVNPLRGQNNVQGACDMGTLPNVFPGYQKVDNPEVRLRFEAAWGSPLSGSPGLPMTEVFGAISAGAVKAAYIMGENPVLSEADAHHVEASLRRLEFLVVQDIFLTETARLADVVLPAATFAEKDGTFTNTERRVQRVRKALEPAGDSRSDWWIIAEIARRMGADGFSFSHPAEIMEEIAGLAPSYRGISYERLDNGGLQWPCPSPDHPGTPILHTERFATPDGKARFLPLQYKPSAELPDDEYPFVLTTDRSLFHYHTGTMTRRTAGLEKLDGCELLRIHPQDAGRLGIADGETVRLCSRRGTVTVQADVTEVCPPGMVSMTFHFAETPTNVLTHAALDPVAKIPETKVCAVRIETCTE